MIEIMLVALGGACGALSRWGITKVAHNLLGHGFAWGTFAANMIGCFILGLLMHFAVATDRIPAHLRLAVGVGFLGALTTFSTFSYETMMMLEQGRYTHAGLNIGLNLVIGLTATLAGLAAARALT